MQDAVHSERIFRFGTFELDLETEELRRNGLKLKLSGQPFQVLAILLERPGRIVTREELQKRLWPDTFVDVDHNLNSAVNKIREVLGDSAETPRFVETVPRRGYRFIAPATGLQTNGTATIGSRIDDPDGRASHAEPNKSSRPVSETRALRPLFWKVVVLGVIALAAFLIAAVEHFSRPLPPPHITEFLRLTLDGKHKYPIGADSGRLYLNLGDAPRGAGFISLSGGEVTRIPFDVPNPNPFIAAVSPDGARLLVFGKIDFGEGELWNIESPGRSGHYLAKASAATWSPDGKQVLYSTLHGDLFVVSSEGGEPKLLLPSPAGSGETLSISNLSWSPDGTRIRFVRYQKYWEISSGGANLHRLLPDWDDSTLACCGSWTPDGDFFLFLAGDTLKYATGGAYETGGAMGAQIWALDERKSWPRPLRAGPIRLTEGPNLWSSPIVSRDGKKIFSKQATVRGELVRYNAEAKRYDPFLGGISAQFVAFSHDGKYVAYVTFPDGTLWRARLDGTERVQLTGPPFTPKGAVWSADGTHILFQDDSGGKLVVYTISSQGGAPVRLIPEDPRPQVDPTWNPDGTRVAYCTDLRFSPKLESESFRKFETHILDLASHTVITLPPFKDGFYSPRWSPDGRLIVGMTLSQAGLELFDLQTRQYRSLLRLPIKDPEAIGWNTWSHDGRYVYFNTLDALMRIPVSGGKPEKVIDLRDFQFTGWWFHPGSFSLDPQDAPILLRDRGTQEIYALTLERK